ncbi:hypothetical protein WP50_33485, partial [Lactiplantibacillus plantarum]
MNVIEFFSSAGEPITDIFYRPDGSRMAEQYYTHDNNWTNYVSLCHLINYHGRDYYFNGEQEWYRFFLDELNKQYDENNVFIADRPLAAQWPVVNMQTAAKKYLWLPTPHAVDPRDQLITSIILFSVLIMMNGALRPAINSSRQPGHQSRIFSIDQMVVGWPNSIIRMIII